MGRKISARLIAEVSRVLAEQGLNIDAITRLTGRVPLENNEQKGKTRACVEMSVRGTPKDRPFLHSEFMRISQDMGYDISFQEDNLFRRNRRLICFDMDSTLIQTEVIDELAMRAGVGDEVKAITESAMRGEIDFCESFKRRVSLLKGLDESVMKEIAENLPITEGVARTLKILKQYGYKIAILSGGFTYFGKHLQEKFGIVDGKRKAELLRLIAQIEHLDLQQVIAVGDGANDLPMLNLAGLGIAYHAKPKVKENAKQSISSIGIDGVLYMLGFKDSYIQ